MKRSRFTFQAALATSLSLILVCVLREPAAAQQVNQGQTKSPPAKAMVIKPKGYIPQPASPESKKGEQYYEQGHCSACHSIGDVGGTIGPMLDGVGQRRSAEFLNARLSDAPEAVASYAKLTGQNLHNLAPHVRVSPDTAHALVSFLLTLPEPKGGFAVISHESGVVGRPAPDLNFRPVAKTAASEEGRQLYEKAGCAQCHQIQNAGGFLGPDLDGIGQVVDRDYIANHITNAQAHALTTDQFFELVPSSMPKFKLTPEQVQGITDYLMTLPKSQQAP